MEQQIYFKYSDYLKGRYGCKVYKLPVNLDITCPNRDGRLAVNGCDFCGEKGAGFENLPVDFPVKKQLILNMEKIRTLYKAEKFIAYFQNYTNTYMKLTDFSELIHQAVMENIVEISVSTRPDCICDDYLAELKKLSEETGLGVTVELGLQTANYHTLKQINRGHGLAEYIDAMLRLKRFGIKVCTHLILNLPQDTDEDAIETAKIISALQTDFVKLHALYIIRDSAMGRQYANGNISLISADEYKERVILFLTYLSPNIAVERLIGRAPEGDALFANWSTSWWKIRDDIEAMMHKRGIYQGIGFNYLNGERTLKW